MLVVALHTEARDLGKVIVPDLNINILIWTPPGYCET